MLREINVFLSALITGITTGFIYDLLRMKRKALKTRAFIVGVEDVLFWIFTAILVFITAYISNQGEIRLYFFMAMALGISLYFWLFSSLITQFTVFTVKLVLWPFAKLVALLKPPVKRLKMLFSKVSQKAGRKMKDCRFVVRRRFRSLRNIVRKI
ncbi:spore cortex biosynthesis protein YabQ [Thermoclostridium stercorarium subsp. stercorarium DSM 8532]|jgi:spore cortex biosynthesis protein YabQ|uniref:Spore cortex biosynthesis protein YabQ n=3 Tax=Thermoclostridium stercorarium TaxID=1510 RepID=L7VKU4_THES1|nr:spore cortex biosynthesis protein YabQ [Thermoclostridium stercorarium]AGC67284.1 spore cortex biosynthesis protein YabQ [Thermoclostridium stercorarium subsp. stercorarium DSM 8532]AGI38350.1 spore cortex protein YabQ [Thermoclostridium stercorarium subsp. stercorarium DSM 8532]ANW97787.1 spore cortex biosynthesis protein YabQ [Thermoclostridium stercorarium subsp. thermolacticum DSM 2910]ANX00313.1 spore cortex biosynthesis protein YabQ [Thermoclostridium stercorarium subsp. leptospartum D